MFTDAAYTPTGSIIISVILGLGLAALFRRACKGKECVIVKAPPTNDTNNYVYKIDDDCYKYHKTAAQCPENI